MVAILLQSVLDNESEINQTEQSNSMTTDVTADKVCADTVCVYMCVCGILYF